MGWHKGVTHLRMSESNTMGLAGHLSQSRAVLSALGVASVSAA